MNDSEEPLAGLPRRCILGCILGFLFGVGLTVSSYGFMEFAPSPEAHDSLSSLHMVVSFPGILIEDLLGLHYAFAEESRMQHISVIAITNGFLVSIFAAVLGWLVGKRRQDADTKRYSRSPLRPLAVFLVGFLAGSGLTLTAYLFCRVAPGGENAITVLVMLLQALLYKPAQILSATFGLGWRFPDFLHMKLLSVIAMSTLNGATLALITSLGSFLTKRRSQRD